MTDSDAQWNNATHWREHEEDHHSTRPKHTPELGATGSVGSLARSGFGGVKIEHAD
jgi:hypothetical protein